jgi:hypothetical protein
MMRVPRIFPRWYLGYIIVCGSGGRQLELLRDTSCRLAPMTDVTARHARRPCEAWGITTGISRVPPRRRVVLRVSDLPPANE